MIKNLISFMLFFVVQAAYALESHKYKNQDCITPIDSDYSWFGKFARVEAFSKVDGYKERVYILAFPSSISNDVIFEKTIETKTKLVAKEHCVSTG